jgi:hypothetical protein
VDADQAVAFPIDFIDPIHRLHDVVDGLARELVAQDLEA